MNIILIGEKGVGKSTLESALCSSHKFKKVVSYVANRKIRQGETNGVDYHFISEQEFKKKIDNNFFAEKNSREDSNHNTLYYGIAKKDLLNNKNNVIVVETKGLFQILNTIPRKELFIVKLSCSHQERIRRVIERDEPKSFNDAIKIIKDMKEDEKAFNVDIPYDVEFDTGKIDLIDIVYDIITNDKVYYSTQFNTKEER